MLAHCTLGQNVVFIFEQVQAQRRRQDYVSRWNINEYHLSKININAKYNYMVSIAPPTNGCTY